MTWEGWFTLGTIALVIGGLMTNRISVDVAMMGGLTLLMLLGIVEVPAAIEGFAHPAVLMIGSLFVLAAGLQETGGMEAIAQRLLGRPRTIAAAQLRMMGPVAVMSGFMNNTPIVAMYLPIISDWARKLRVSPSKLFMPLSFAAILGGKLTLIGTASNIVVLGLYLSYLESQPDLPALSPEKQFWGIAALGVPTALVGLAFILLASRWLLPERRPANQVTLDARRYQVEMEVRPDSPIVGKTIEEAGLRHLPGLYLTEIERNDRVLPAVSPRERIQANDRLAFAGILESVRDLRKIRGLVPATDQVQKVTARPAQRILVEAVVARNSPLVGQSVRKSRFRTTYNAAIIAVHRNGQRVDKKIGDITLQPGDTLLLDTHLGFVEAYRNSDDFYLVSSVEGSRPVRHDRAWIALGLFGLLVCLLTFTRVPPVVAALFCALGMIGTRCVTGTIARSSINWQVLIVIAAALGIGRALSETGAAESIAHALLTACAGLSPQAMLMVTYLLAAAFAQLITNNGAAVLMFPIAMNTAQDLGVSPEPFMFILMLGAGCSFMSPVAYQTNLMVYGPGGYRFLDYARLGAPLTLLVGVVAVLVAPLAYPLTAVP